MSQWYLFNSLYCSIIHVSNILFFIFGLVLILGHCTEEAASDPFQKSRGSTYRCDGFQQQGRGLMCSSLDYKFSKIRRTYNCGQLQQFICLLIWF